MGWSVLDSKLLKQFILFGFELSWVLRKKERERKKWDRERKERDRERERERETGRRRKRERERIISLQNKIYTINWLLLQFVGFESTNLFMVFIWVWKLWGMVYCFFFWGGGGVEHLCYLISSSKQENVFRITRHLFKWPKTSPSLFVFFSFSQTSFHQII